MPKRHILHILNIDTVGGVEALFIHFLKNTQDTITHTLLIKGNKPHLFFKETIATCAENVFYEKFLKNIKLPKALRFLQKPFLHHKLRKIHFDAVVIWNRLADIQSIQKSFGSSPIIYYEHGASWIAKKESVPTIFQQAEHILANSFAAKKVLQCKWNLSNPITVIDNPLRPDIEPAKETKSIKGKETVHLGYVGRLIPLKGVSLLLFAMKKLIENNYKTVLHIAGSGSEAKTLKELAKSLNIEKQVFFHGAIEDIAPFYSMIDILLIPSIREPLGLVAQEAALKGSPVIAARVDGLPEVVQNNKTGITIEPTLSINRYPEFGGKSCNLPDLVYDPQKENLTPPKILDPKKIAETVATLISHPNIYEKMSRAAIDFAQKRPSFMEYTNTLLQKIFQKE